MNLEHKLYRLTMSVYSFFYNKCVLQMHIVGYYITCKVPLTISEE